jgi:peptide chain release factor 1
MKPSLLLKLEQLAQRLEEVGALLNQEGATADMDQYRKLTREHSELEPLIALHAQWNQANDDLRAARDMLSDPEMKAFAQEEIDAAQMRAEQLEIELQKMMLPKDPNDERNIFLEIRAGTGGDESALFAGDLLRMYSRYAERQRWQVEMVSESASELGGYKEVIVRLVGNGVYSRMKFESGGHRVQRVPETEAQGRIIHPPAPSPLCLKPTKSAKSISTQQIFASIRIAHLVLADSTSTKLILPFESRIYQQVSWWSAKMTAANTKIKRRR